MHMAITPCLFYKSVNLFRKVSKKENEYTMNKIGEGNEPGN